MSRMNLTDDLQATLESAGQSVEPPTAPNLGGVKARAAQRRRRKTQGTALGVSMLVAILGGAALLLSQPDDDRIFLETDVADQTEQSTTTTVPDDADAPGDAGSGTQQGSGVGPPAAIDWTPAELDSPISRVVWTGDRYLAAQVKLVDGEQVTTLLTSLDGQSWDRSPVEVDGTVAAVAGNQDELAVAVVGEADGFNSGPPRSVHYSSDGGATWVELDVLFDAEPQPVSPHVSRWLNVETVAVRNGTVLVSGSQFDTLDVVAVVAERTDFEGPSNGAYEQTYSGVSFTQRDGSQVTVPFADLNLTNEERQALQGATPTGFLLRSTGSGRPLGPIPDLDVKVNRVFTTDDGFMGTSPWVGSFWSSPDGITWDRIPSAPGGLGQVSGSGGRVALIDWSGATPRLRISENGGASWATSELPADGSDVTSIAIGPAGIAVLLIEGDEFATTDDDSLRLEKDGFSVYLADDAVITDLATGQEVLRVSEDEAMSGQSDVVEIGGGGSAFTFFHPETGEELLTVTQADIMSVMFADAAVQVLWSDDGTDWAPLDLGDLDGIGADFNLDALAVGEDSLVIGGLTGTDDEPVTVVGIPAD